MHTKIPTDLSSTLERFSSWQPKKFIISFTIPESLSSPEELNTLIKKNLFTLKLTPDLIRNIFDVSDTILAEEPPGLSPIIRPQNMDSFCAKFAQDILAGDHFSKCELFEQFIQKFERIPTDDRALRHLLNSFPFQNPQNNNFIDELFEELLVQSEYRRSLLDTRKVKNPKTKNNRLKSILAVFLVFVRGCKYRQVQQILKLTPNQIKKAVRAARDQKFMQPYQEKRGAHMKNRLRLTPVHATFIENWIRQRATKFSLQDLRGALQSEFNGLTLSRQTVSHFLKTHYNFHFGPTTPYPAAKNSDEARGYRFWFVHAMMSSFVEGDLVVSIDETGFSSYRAKPYLWTSPILKVGSEYRNFENIPNLTLLLAVSHDQVLGFTVVEGAVDSILFADFLLRLDSCIFDSFGEKANPVYLMDNCRCHFTPLVEKIMIFRRMRIVFTPKYSPEVNWVEHVFCLIKNKMSKMAACKNK